MILRNLNAIGLMMLFSFLIGCGIDASKDENNASDEIIEDSIENNDLMDVNINFKTKQAGILLTAIANTYSLTIDNCASGYSLTVNESSQFIKAYKSDWNCLAKLNNFSVNGYFFEPDPLDPFTTWQVGDKATFVAIEDPSNQITVEVMSTLNSPISGDEVISYAFYDINKGDDENIGKDAVSDPHAISIHGELAPNFNVGKVSYLGMNPDGSGQFLIKLNCAVEIVGEAEATACDSQLMSDFRYKLVQDNFASELSIDQASQLFPFGEEGINLNEDILPVGDMDAPNGGFQSKILSGPPQMHLHPNMIFIIELNDTSYQYWNIDVENL